MKYLLLVLLVATGWTCSPKMSPDKNWENNRWIVVEMKGVPVQQSGGRRDAFLNFLPDTKTFNGNAGCNQINGSYSIEKKEIHFANIISTKMSCNDMAFETTLLNTLSTIDNFVVKGEDIHLRKKKETQLVLRARDSR